ncbi:hypothetical protein FK514_29500, partial [Klebsiella pneumoniae]|nr:hypothetical protein [Klebsiella pneumoniae]
DPDTVAVNFGFDVAVGGAGDAANWTTDYLNSDYSWIPRITLDNCIPAIIHTPGAKALSPGLRLGFMVADPDLIDEARALRRLVYRHPPTNIQY